jgi:hypothetical protein
MRYVITGLIGISLCCLVAGCESTPSADQGNTENPGPATGQANATLPSSGDVASGDGKEAVDSSKYVLVSLNVPNMT